jgi:hypothetical protein
MRASERSALWQASDGACDRARRGEGTAVQAAPARESYCGARLLALKRRHRAGSRSDRSAIAWNAKSIDTSFKSTEENDAAAGARALDAQMYFRIEINSNDWKLEELKSRTSRAAI